MASENCLLKQYWERFFTSTWPNFCDLDWPVDPSSAWFPRQASSIDPHQCSYLPRFRTKVIHTSTNYASKLVVMPLLWSAKLEIPQSSFICVLPVLSRHTGSKAKTLHL